MSATASEGLGPPAWSVGTVIGSLLHNIAHWPLRLLRGRWRACDLEVARQAHLATQGALLPACGAALVTGFSYMVIAESHNEFGMAARDTGLGYFGNFLLTHVIPLSMAHLVVNRGALSLGMDLALAPRRDGEDTEPLDTVFFPRVMAQMLIGPALSVFGILGMAVGAWIASQFVTDAGEAFPEFCLKLFKRCGPTDVLLVPAKTGIIAFVTCCVAAVGAMPRLTSGESPGVVATRVMTRSVFSIIVTNSAVSVVVDVIRRWA